MAEASIDVAKQGVPSELFREVVESRAATADGRRQIVSLIRSTLLNTTKVNPIVQSACAQVIGMKYLLGEEIDEELLRICRRYISLCAPIQYANDSN